MNLNNLDLTAFVPQFMKNDKDTQGFIYAIQNELKLAIENIKHASIYARIDDLDEKVLDILADQFSISEYNISYDITIKRSIVKKCLLTHHLRGTVASVENIVNDVFGEARVEEWFNYSGNPYYFKVYTSNVSATDEMLAEFDRIIKSTQNCRSYLEAAIVELYQSMDVYVAGSCSISSIEQFKCNL